MILVGSVRTGGLAGAHCVALLPLLAMAAGCPAPRAAAYRGPAEALDGTGGPPIDPPHSEDADGGGAGDVRMLVLPTGLAFDLPVGWVPRRGEGDLAWEASSPRSPAAILRVGGWDGEVERLEEHYGPASDGWSAQGPWAALEDLGGGPPWVGSRQGPDGALDVGWYFQVDGRFFAITAELPARDFEAAWRDADGFVRSARRWAAP